MASADAELTGMGTLRGIHIPSDAPSAIRRVCCAAGASGWVPRTQTVPMGVHAGGQAGGGAGTSRPVTGSMAAPGGCVTHTHAGARDVEMAA